jgi:hypothetical protein
VITCIRHSWRGFCRHCAALSHGTQLTNELVEALTIEQEGAIRVVWAPFSYLQKGARVVLLGITPGRHQAELEEAQTARIDRLNIRLQALNLFLVGFLVLFLELACIRWFAAYVVFSSSLTWSSSPLS